MIVHSTEASLNSSCKENSARDMSAGTKPGSAIPKSFKLSQHKYPII